MRQVVLALLLSLVTGCDGIGDRIKSFVAPVPPAAVTVEVICDFGGGSSGCTAVSLESLLREITPSLPAGSVVRLHGMADDVAQATQLATFSTTAPKKKTVRAVAGHRRRQTDAIVSEFLSAAQPLLANEVRRASPIAETIGRVLLAGNPTHGPQVLYVLTDGRQYSKSSPALGTLDYECGPILSGDEFGQRLRALLPERSADGVTIHFRHAKLEPVGKNRCAASIERYSQLKNTWTEALQAQGATVTWSMN